MTTRAAMGVKRAASLAAAAALVVVPATVLASGGEGHGPDWPRIGASIINFAVYVGIIVYFAGPKIQAAMKARRDGLMSSIDAAAAKRSEAEAKLADATRLAAGLAAERDSLMGEAREIGQRDAERAVASAKAQAGKIADDARVAAEAATRRLQRELEAQLVERALGLAREELARRMTPAAQARLLDAGIQDIVSAAQAPRA